MAKIECTCEHCGNAYTPYSSAENPRFCSRDCYREHISNTHICIHCGKAFKHGNSKAKFCSNECNDCFSRKLDNQCEWCEDIHNGEIWRWNSALILRRSWIYWREKKQQFTCPVCNKKFIPKQWSKKPAVYCSRKCQGVFLTNKIERTCLECGKIFLTIPYTLEQGYGKYCSRACLGKANGKRNAGANCSFWRGGGVRYYRGPNWLSQRKLAYERDNGICQHCKNGYNGKRKNSVHHIKPFRNYAEEYGDKAYVYANVLTNLITLCHACHRKAESGKIILQPKLL